MFDQVPVQAWLLVAVAAVAYSPAVYAYRYLAHSPSRRDITQPPQDLSWRTSRQFSISATILVASAAFAIFIFTPHAARFAGSPSFMPVLLGALGTWALSTVLKGFNGGRIEPIVRGFNRTYERETEPKRFWASMVWNGFFGSLCIWLSFVTIKEAPTRSLEEKCYDAKNIHSPRTEISACTTLIDERRKSGSNPADLLAARGTAYHRSGDYDRAMADYTNAIQLDHTDSSSHYNRGLIHDLRGDSPRATSEYTAAIRLRVDNDDAYIHRGLIFLNEGSLDEAVNDFTRAHEIKPASSIPLANRGMAYAWQNDRARAKRDFAAVRAIDPSSILPLRGEALLSMNAGDADIAVERLTAALKQVPADQWSLNMRSVAYGALGEKEKSRADAERLRLLMKAANAAERPTP